MANRIDFNQPCVPLDEGLGLLQALTAHVLESAENTDEDRREILDAYHMQRVDVLFQSWLRGSAAVRARARGLIPSELTQAAVRPSVRRYVAGKLLEKFLCRYRGVALGH
jgi:hypothetical protein